MGRILLHANSQGYCSWTKASVFIGCYLEVTLRSWPSGPPLWQFHNIVAFFIRASEKSQRECRQLEVTVFYNQISEITLGTFLYCYLLQDSYWVQPIITMRKQRSPGSHLRSLPTASSNLLPVIL